jgi:hypothetical protein
MVVSRPVEIRISIYVLQNIFRGKYILPRKSREKQYHIRASLG